MRLVWDERAWEDYIYWQETDKRMLKKLNLVLKDIQRNVYVGIGKPEALTGKLTTWWSRRIDNQNRIVYKEENGNILIMSCKGHYN